MYSTATKQEPYQGKYVVTEINCVVMLVVQVFPNFQQLKTLLFPQVCIEIKTYLLVDFCRQD